ncbi:MAG: hypothetical protein C0392_14810 [Syntrophus sp. (in: bacteria)]|nr:hypothetical protein [Syntrophus sp. (in: bacteria)]
MKRFFCIMAIIACSLGIGFSSAFAGYTSDLTLQGVNTMVGTYGGYYVGPIQGNITGSAQTGFICNDYITPTSVPNNFQVYVGTLSPVDLSHAKFATNPSYTPEQLFKYQEAAWLLGQMKPFVAAHDTTNVGLIQFAIWSIFNPSTPDKGQGSWLTAASQINPNNLDFSSVRIYSATNTANQEFMSGSASPVPLPPSVLLLAPGLLGLVVLRKRFHM